MKRTLQLALLLALFLVCGRSAFAQAGFVAGQAFTYTPGGAFPAGGSIVTICTTGGTGTPCTPTVTLYQDSAASIPVANPLAACTSSPQIGCLDGYGNFSFYVAVAGAYTYTITSLSGLNPYGPVPIIAQTIGGGATAANLLGPGFISGTFSGNNKLTGTTTAAQINNTIYIDGTVYACDDVGINAAITALGTAGGIVDASYCIGFGVNGGKNILATVIVGANTGTASNGVLLKFGCDSSAWLVSPTISAQHVFEVADNSAIEGCAYGGTRIFVSNTGTPSLLDVVSFIGNPANSSITENARVSNLWIENDNASATITNGLINLQTAYDSVIQDVKLVGYAPCLLYASDTASGAIAPNSDDIINLLADGLDDAGTQPICIQSVAGGYPGPIRFYGGDFGHPGAGKNLVLINTPAGIGHSYGIRFTNVYMEGNAAADTTTPLIAASDTEGLSLDGVWAGMNSTSTASCLSLSSTLGVTGAITVKDFTCTSLSGTTNAITSTVTGAPSFTGTQVTYYSANGDGLLASGKSSVLLGGVRQLCFNGSTSGVACIQPAPVAGTPCNLLLPAANPTVGQILSSAAPSGSPSTCQTSWTSSIVGAGGILTTNQTVSSSPCVGIATGLILPAGVFACSGLSNPIQTVGSVQFNAGTGFGSIVFNNATGYLTFDGVTSGGASIGVAAVAGTPCTILWPTLSPTSGQVLSSAAPSGSPSTCQTSWSSASSGTTTNQTAKGLSYNSSGTATAVDASIAAPTTQGQYECGYTLPTAAAVIPTCPLVGLVPDALAGAAVLFTDNNNEIDYPASALSIPVPTTSVASGGLGNQNFYTVISNDQATASTLTPTTWTISKDGAAAAATAVVDPHTKCALKVDQITSTQWDLTCVPLEGYGGVTAITSADWTCGTTGTVADCTTAHLIGNLTFTLPKAVVNWTVDCNGVVGQATGATANSWNIQTATNASTNLAAGYNMNTAATAMTGGAVTGASSTTTQVIAPTWTLGATGTKMPFHIWATVEGASASGTVVNIQLVAPTVGDLVTIYRGTVCRAQIQ